MYKISAQCAKARGAYDEAFGGINMIFAGDFGQLPPAMSGAPLYSGAIGIQIDSSQTIANQEAAIGKVLWHQLTTVVILCENMRQTNQSEEDVHLRLALENMRYKACTPNDIAFLHTCVAGKGPNDPKLAQKKFRNISVVTALNAQKDKINELGIQHFAAENKRPLTSFYSIDRWNDHTSSNGKRKSHHMSTILDPHKNIGTFTSKTTLEPTTCIIL
jgi:hypothetical protein